MANEINSNRILPRNNTNVFDSFRRVHASSFRTKTCSRSTFLPMASFKGIKGTIEIDLSVNH